MVGLDVVRISLAWAMFLSALALSGCGSSSGGAKTGGDKGATGYEKVFAAVKGLHGKTRLAKLLALAKAEGGAVTVYTSARSDVSEGLASAFEDAYGLDVALYRANTEAVAERITEEAKANFRGGDVTELDGVALYNLNRASLIVDYDPDGLSQLGAGANRDGWTVTEFRKFTVSWNTDRVKNGEQPRTWEDLADPKWKGKLAMEFGDFEWYGTLRDYWINQEGKTPAEADRLFAQMGRNALVLTGHTLMTELLAAGELDVAATPFSSTVDDLRKKGAPIARLPAVEPVVVRSNGVALVRHARNPAAAVLYLEWLVGPGQKVAFDLGRDPARRDLATAETFKTISVDYSKLVEHQDEWSTQYERFLSKGKEVHKGG
jgi:iron(III) transport system substrate-binding protein